MQNSIKKIVLASNNVYKLKEFQQVFTKYGIEIISPKSFGILFDAEETGVTFQENSLIKARELRKKIDFPVISDDSGLVVPKLNGEPGVHSARYSGENATDASNRQKLLEKCKKNSLENPEAYFVCAISFIGSKELFVEGYCHGSITSKERGKNGFGYDPVFIPQNFEKTLAEISSKEKNKISHRADAIKKIVKKLEHNHII
jgi:XTP/dITP diphosphohydrolase